MHEELLEKGIEKWFASRRVCQEPSTNKMIGTVVFKTFKETITVLIKGSSINRVEFRHNWYSNWSWIVADNLKEFFEALHNTLNDDCVRDVIKYLDLEHIIYFAHFNERFECIANEKLTRIHIFPFTSGPIGLMNFRYLLEMCDDSLTELSISLNAFRTTFGMYTEEVKGHILQIIHECAGTGLKTVNLYDFYLDESFRHKFEWFLQRDINITSV